MFLVFVKQIQYKSDCEQLYGRILDNRNVVSSVQGTSRGQTEQVWSELYPGEPYDINLTGSFSEGSEQIYAAAKYTKYDLVSAVKRQSPFFYQV